MYMAVISSIPRIGASGTRKPCWKARSIRNARFAASKTRMLVLRTDKGAGNNNGLSVPRGFGPGAMSDVNAVMRANPDIGQALPDGIELMSTRPGVQQPRQMLLILRSSAASSRLAGVFGLLRFFSDGTSSARGCRWPIGASRKGGG